MSSNKRLKKRDSLKIMIRQKNLLSAGVSLLLVVKVESNSLYVSHVRGELSLAVQCKTCTIQPSQSCNFKKLKVFETKLNIQNMVIAFFKLADRMRSMRTNGASKNRDYSDTNGDHFPHKQI